MGTPCFITSVPIRNSFTSTGKSISTRNTQLASRSLKYSPTLPETSVSSIRSEAEGAVKEKLAWVDAIEVSQISVGKSQRVIIAGLDICIACDFDGQVYALGNKGPPLGVPLSDGTVVEEDGTGYVKCPQYGTLFSLRTGEVKDKASWIISPPLVSNLLRIIFSEPTGVPVYDIRESGGMIQVCVNVNARAQYEEKYWKGLLDASGKADGGYY